MQEDKFSAWQQKMSKRHPLLSQFIVSIIVGVILMSFPTWWTIENVLSKITAKSEIISEEKKEVEVKIGNDGWMPADYEYEIRSGNVVSFNIKAGEKYITLEETKDPKVTRAIVKDLPKSEVIQIYITGSNDIKINNPKIKKVIIGVLILLVLIAIWLFIVKIVKFVKSERSKSSLP